MTLLNGRPRNNLDPKIILFQLMLSTTVSFYTDTCRVDCSLMMMW